MINCPNCDKEISGNSKFCRFCGDNLSGKDKEWVHKIEDANKPLPIEEKEYGGFWIRFGAYMVDFLCVMGISFTLGIFFSDFIQGIPEWFDFLFGSIILVTYNTLTLGIFSTTFGKYLYGLKINTENDEDLNFEIALRRSMLQILSTLLWGIGYWKMSKNDKQQAWHDEKAKTIVVRRKKNLFLAYIFTVIAIIVWVYFTYFPPAAQ